MKSLLILALFTQSVMALGRGWCHERALNYAEVRSLMARFVTLPPKPSAIGAYSCRLISAYGCNEVVQQDVPVKVRATRDAATKAYQFGVGVPKFLTERHWFYDRSLRAVVSDAGALREPFGTGQAIGYVRGTADAFVALITESGNSIDAVKDIYDCVRRPAATNP